MFTANCPFVIYKSTGLQDLSMCVLSSRLYSQFLVHSQRPLRAFYETLKRFLVLRAHPVWAMRERAGLVLGHV